MQNDKIKRLNEFIKKNNMKNYPISNPQLIDATDYIRNNYFKMLALILQQTEITDAQYSLMKRLISGVKAEYELEEYLRQALDIEIEEYVEFTEQMKELNVKYRFILDAALLSCCSANNEEQLSMTVSFAEAMQLTKANVKYIAELCKAIMEQDSYGYRMLSLEDNPLFSDDEIADYIDDCHDDIFIINEEKIIICNAEKKAMDIDALVSEDGSILQDTVYIENAIFTLHYLPVLFDSCENVTFINCDFVDSKHSLKFTDVLNVTFCGCNFKNFLDRVIIQEQVGALSITDCHFDHCYYFYENSSRYASELGALLFSSDRNANAINMIEDSSFSYCGGINSHYQHANAFLSNCLSVVKNCSFDNCWHYTNSTTPRDGGCDEYYYSLFLSGTTIENCEKTNSADLVYG